MNIEDNLLKRIYWYLEQYYNLSDGEEMQQLKEDIHTFKELLNYARWSVFNLKIALEEN